ncbi:GntR family transcriptional regulator [Nakamurella endophytica]|uniref:GntR family transcriptional regulator n=1 Tax=Nakamurella endophytica TaxID=1748367 RepID=A0A917SRG6_9ACTN|nr:GntR family transcriptional regulator [Nakamurella endophytica]GGL95478.1 GntR family transcriptional regulator [Nakamurella endophytica]
MHATARPPSAADRAYQHIRDGILSRRYGDNDLLGEGRLAEETGVSRTPVREALVRLAADGLVQLLPKRGALVLPVTASEARDVLETRELVEGHCVRAVVEAGGGPALAAQLEEPLHRLDLAADTGDLAGYVTADRDFHATVVAAAGNRILIRLYAGLRDRQLRMGAANLGAPDGRIDEQRMRRTVRDHRDIAAAIGRGDVAGALAVTARHLAQAARDLR